ncbi:hypothetical protein WJX84_011021, partial [Apatococcus fuscideae]
MGVPGLAMMEILKPGANKGLCLLTSKDLLRRLVPWLSMHIGVPVTLATDAWLRSIGSRLCNSLLTSIHAAQSPAGCAHAAAPSGILSSDRHQAASSPARLRPEPGPAAPRAQGKASAAQAPSGYPTPSGSSSSDSSSTSSHETRAPETPEDGSSASNDGSASSGNSSGSIGFVPGLEEMVDRIAVLIADGGAGVMEDRGGPLGHVKIFPHGRQQEALEEVDHAKANSCYSKAGIKAKGYAQLYATQVGNKLVLQYAACTNSMAEYYSLHDGKPFRAPVKLEKPQKPRKNKRRKGSSRAKSSQSRKAKRQNHSQPLY